MEIGSYLCEMYEMYFKKSLEYMRMAEVIPKEILFTKQFILSLFIRFICRGFYNILIYLYLISKFNIKILNILNRLNIIEYCLI